MSEGSGGTYDQSNPNELIVERGQFFQPFERYHGEFMEQIVKSRESTNNPYLEYWKRFRVRNTPGAFGFCISNYEGLGNISRADQPRRVGIVTSLNHNVVLMVNHAQVPQLEQLLESPLVAFHAQVDPLAGVSQHSLVRDQDIQLRFFGKNLFVNKDPEELDGPLYGSTEWSHVEGAQLVNISKAPRRLLPGLIVAIPAVDEDLIRSLEIAVA